jgi:hypothetical protein
MPGNKKALIGTACLLALLAGLWLFPRVWYTRSETNRNPVWLSERTNVAGWSFAEVPVSEAAERLLVADRMVSGEFTSPTNRISVRVFSAKRYSEKPNEIGLFVHTPDRCWTQGGWKFEPVSPDSVELTVHGRKMVFERRLFVHGAQRELVYFGGLVGGQPLPFRLDHNLSVGFKYATDRAQGGVDTRGGGARAADKRFWARIWDSFTSRSQLLGPKQFIRISTSVYGADLARGDQTLQALLEAWLEPVEYEKELIAWQERKT